MTVPKKTLIAFATRWGAQFGGINSFNQDLLSAFAAVSYQQVSTVCVVLDANDEEKESANSAQVRLVSLGCHEQREFLPALVALAWQAVQDDGIHIDASQMIWLGHDRITGDIALVAKEKYGGRSALIHHMSYSHYEAFAENSATAKAKETEQTRLFKQADIVIAVGPLLRDALADMLDKQNVPMLVPGLPEIAAKRAPNSFKGFISGRLSEDAKKIKQAHLGVAAFGDAIRQACENTGLPDSLQSKREPSLTLRGVDFEKSHCGYDAEAEYELNLFAEKHAGNRVFRFHALPFTTDREVLFEDLRGSSVSMMPSWHEGFGLVAWEAIGAGVPLIVSNKSGAYRMLDELKHGLYTSYVTPIDVAGSNREPFFQDKDVSNLAEALIGIAKNPTAARQKAASLREALCSEYTWANCAREFLDILGWQFDTSGPMRTANLKISAPPQPATSPPLINLLELPSPSWQLNTGLSDSQLLRAEEAIVPFDAKRKPFLETQTDWAASSDYPIKIRLLTGAGGVGKTRLALELCSRLQEKGWQAGFLISDCEMGQAATLASQIIKAVQPCCVVIDYAETRQPILLAVLKSLLLNPPKCPVRLLLLARDGGEWWESLHTKEASCESLLQGLASSGPFTLPQLHDSECDRQEAYLVALTSLSTRLQTTAPEHSPRLSEAHFARPLYIQMAALMALRGERPKSAEALPRAMISHERRYWAKALSGLTGDRSEHEKQASLLMVLATLANGIVTDRMIERVWLSIGEDKAQLKKLFNLLTPLYPDRQGLQGLRPDLIGEALVAQVILSPIGVRVLDGIMRSNDRRFRHSSLTVLARLLRYREELGSIIEDMLVKHFIACADDLVTVCIETPSPMPQIVERAYGRLPKALKWQAAGVLGPRLHFEVLPLTGLDVLVSQSLVDKKAEQLRKKRGDNEAAEHANELRDLSIALYRHGSKKEAMDAARKCLDIYVKLAEAKPERFTPYLAEALEIFANRMGELDRTEEALAAAKQAKDIYIELAQTKSESFEPSLASALNIYATRLIAVGNVDESLNAVRRSLDIYQKLAHTNPEGHEYNLAAVFNNYANLLSEKGMPEEALIACKKSVSIFGKLSQSKPERAELYFAQSLNNYAVHLSDNGRNEEALVISKQALDIFLKLALAKPQRFESELADALNIYGFRLAAQGDLEATVAVSKNALDIYENLALTKPELYLNSREQCRLQLAHWQWLTNDDTVLKTVNQPLVNIENIRKLRELEFIKAWLLAFLEKESGTLQHALNCWSALDHSQQHAHEHSYLLLAALAEVKYGAAVAPKNWRNQLEAYRAQRKGHIPFWMIEVARRTCLEL